jgi:hypothetical protein
MPSLAIMPRFALALLFVSACFFDADYSHAHLRCSDNACPSGLSCIDDECTAPRDASGSDAVVMHAMTCNDPGIAVDGSQTGTTTGSNQLATMCGGAIYNGHDAVYSIAGNRQVTIGVDSTDFAPAAYVIGACTSFPTCETNMAAQPSAPLTITLGSGMHLVVVDGVNPSLGGRYTLTIH